MSDEPAVVEDIVRTEPFTGTHAELHELKQAHEKLKKAHAKLKDEHEELKAAHAPHKKASHGK